MKKIITLLFLIVAAIQLHAQPLGNPKTNVNVLGGLQVDSLMLPPLYSDTPTSARIRVNGSLIRVVKSGDTGLYQFVNNSWEKLGTSGSGITPTLQAVTNIGNNTTTGISIGTTTGSYFTDSIVVQGTSIEYGTGLSSPSTQAWPIQLGNMLGYGVINLGVPFSTYTGNDSIYRRNPPKRSNIKYVIFGGPVNDANSYPTDTATYAAKMISVMDSLVNYKGYSYSDFYLQTPWFCYRNYRNNVNYPALVIYAKCVRDLVTRKGANLIDLFAFSYPTAGYGYTQDGIHPNYLGLQYDAQYTSGFIPKAQHNANDKFIVKGKVQFGDSIYHMTTTMALPGTGVMLLAKDSTGKEVVIPGNTYMATGNLNSNATGGGIHTTEPISSDRSVNAGTMQMYGTGLNSTWLSENMWYDYNGVSGFSYKQTGYAHMLQWFGAALNYISGGSGTAGAAVSQDIRNRFNDDGSLGLGGKGDNTSSTSIAGHALQIFANKDVVIGSNTDNGYKLDVVGTFRGVRIFAFNPTKTAASTTIDSVVRYNTSTQEFEVAKFFAYGSSTQSGNGSTTVFNIAHGLGVTPTYWNVTPASSAAVGSFYVTADATNLIITYTAAPASGTNNLTFEYSAK